MGGPRPTRVRSTPAPRPRELLGEPRVSNASPRAIASGWDYFGVPDFEGGLDIIWPCALPIIPPPMPIPMPIAVRQP